MKRNVYFIIVALMWAKLIQETVEKMSNVGQLSTVAKKGQQNAKAMTITKNPRRQWC